MASNIGSIRIDVKVRWWVLPYVNTLTWFCCTFGTAPDIGRIAYFIARHGVKIRLAK